jgi:hypothetical protein
MRSKAQPLKLLPRKNHFNIEFFNTIDSLLPLVAQNPNDRIGRVADAA